MDGREEEEEGGEDWAILCCLAIMRPLRVIALPAGFIMSSVLESMGDSLESNAHAATGFYWAVSLGTNYNF